MARVRKVNGQNGDVEALGRELQPRTGIHRFYIRPDLTCTPKPGGETTTDDITLRR
jgi:hypothetical protein